MSEQEDSVTDVLGKLQEGLRMASRDVERLVGVICMHAVDRNALMLRMAPEYDGADEMASVTAAQRELMRTDAEIKHDAEHIRHCVSHSHSIVFGLVKSVEEISARVAQNERRAAAELASAKRQIDALTARLKEHACHNAEVREAVWSITGGRCFYCDRGPIDVGAPGTRGNIFHIDHIVPKDAGGPDHLSNYVPACHSCNSSKGAKSYVEFTRKRQTQLSVIEGGAA